MENNHGWLCSCWHHLLCRTTPTGLCCLTFNLLLTWTFPAWTDAWAYFTTGIRICTYLQWTVWGSCHPIPPAYQHPHKLQPWPPVCPPLNFVPSMSFGNKVGPRSSLAHNVFVLYQRQKWYLKQKVHTCVSVSSIDRSEQKREQSYGMRHHWHLDSEWEKSPNTIKSGSFVKPTSSQSLSSSPSCGHISSAQEQFIQKSKIRTLCLQRQLMQHTLVFCCEL